MPPAIATVAYLCLILGLFWLERNPKVRTSGALWIPVIWFSIACSRSVSQWLQLEKSVASTDQVLDGSPVDRLVFACLLTAGIVVLIGRRKLVGRFLRGNGPILLFFAYCLVSLLWSDYPDVAFKRWTKAVGDLVMVVIVLSDRDPFAALQRLLVRTSFVLIPLSILFIKYFPELGRGYGEWLGEVMYWGVTLNKNSLGVICLFFGLGALWRLIAGYQAPKVEGRTRRLIAQGIIFAMVVWLLRMINAMTSLSCFLMGSVLLCATNYRGVIRRPAIVHTLIATMLLVSVAVLFFGVSPGALQTMGRNPTLTDRTEVWTMVLSLDPNRWVGTGFESFWLGPRLEKMWHRYWWHPGEAHNGYLEIYVNLGWVGIALLFVVIATGYRAVFRAWRSDVVMGSLCLTFFFVGLVYNFTEAAFFRMLAPAWLFLLLAMVGASAVSRRKRQLSAQNHFQQLNPGSRERELLPSSESVAGSVGKSEPSDKLSKTSWAV
jgi:exopolysaccharide production protein ExoQ